MADYYPLITRAVAGLERSTGEGRRALYERARNALVEQLRGVQPPLSETDITRERLALEEAIRKVEAEAVRLMRGDPPPERQETRVAQAETPPPPEENFPEPEAFPTTPPPPLETPAERTPQPRPTRTSERRWLNKKPAEPNPGIRGFSDVVADAENLGGATAEAGRAARETYSSVPSPTPEFDRLEPRLEPGARRAAAPRPRAPERRSIAQPDLGPTIEPPDYEPAGYGGSPPPLRQTRSLEAPHVPDNLRQAVARSRRDQFEDEDGEPTLVRRLLAMGGKIGIAAVVVLLVSGTIYWQRGNIAGAVRSMFSSTRAPTSATPQREATAPRAKIPDRIGQTDANARRQNEIPVVQRAVLYEDDPVEAAGKQYVGTVTWRAESSSAGPGQAADRAVRAEITIPDRNMTVVMTVRRNADRALPATHTVEIQFTLPQDFSNGGISEIRGMLMKQAEDTRGTSLAGLAVKVSPTFFLVGLSSASDADVQRNMQLLKERGWFDIAIVYTNGRRAILAVEKGAPGDRAFADAFAAWGQ